MSKKRFIPDRVPIRRQAPGQRIRNFSEVALGYSDDEARREAERCLLCKKPLCINGCPVGIDIPGFVNDIVEGEFKAGADRIKRNNLLPGVCGRVCPQEDQCEKECILGRKGDPLAIGKLERFVADREAQKGELDVARPQEKTGLAAAVVGSGPAGLTAAAELARRGHRVTVFEALHVAGGSSPTGSPSSACPSG